MRFEHGPLPLRKKLVETGKLDATGDGGSMIRQGWRRQRHRKVGAPALTRALIENDGHEPLK
jgi:hypothetical protein